MNFQYGGKKVLETIKQIASRLKGLREIFGKSTEEIAKTLEISNSNYKEYEDGKVDIPVSILYKASQYYNVELASILTGEEPKLQHYCFVKKGHGVSVERRLGYKYQSLAFNFIHKKAEPFLVTVEPEDSKQTLKLNSHHGQEFNYCLSGELKVVIGNNEVILNEGDSLFFDSTISHGMQAIGKKPVQFLAIVM